MYSCSRPTADVMSAYLRRRATAESRRSRGAYRDHRISQRHRRREVLRVPPTCAIRQSDAQVRRQSSTAITVPKLGVFALAWKLKDDRKLRLQPQICHRRFCGAMITRKDFLPQRIALVHGVTSAECAAHLFYLAALSQVLRRWAIADSRAAELSRGKNAT